MPRYTLERLDKKRHDRKRFTCGNDDLDEYLHKTARQAGDAGTAVCYVLIDPGDPGRIVGYFTLTQHAVDPGPENTALFERQPRIARTLAVPTTLLGRLAIDRDYQGAGLGSALLARALEISLAAADVVASTAVVVDPIDARARAFYEGFGFELLNGETGRLFLTMNTVAAHFDRADLGAIETTGNNGE